MGIMNPRNAGERMGIETRDEAGRMTVYLPARSRPVLSSIAHLSN